MHKKGLGLFLITVISLLITVIAVNAEEETLTITTYYPSPYGSYRELRSQRMAIGNTWYEGATACWDDENPATCSNPSNSTDVNLIVEGRDRWLRLVFYKPR